MQTGAPVNRLLLTLIGLLATLVAVARIGAIEQPTPSLPLPTSPPVRLTSPASGPPRPILVSLEAASPKATPLIDQMARVESRRRLGFFGHQTYLDSMLVSTDSTLRRWPDREDACTPAQHSH